MSFGRKIAVAVAVAAVVAFAASRAYRAISLKAGIKQAQDNLKHVDMLLEQNENDGDEVLRQIIVDLTPLPGENPLLTQSAPQEHAAAPETNQVLDRLLQKKEISPVSGEPSPMGADPIANLKNAYIALLQNPKGIDLNYGLVLSSALERTVDLYGSKDLKLYVKATNLGIDLFEGNAILRQRASLLALRDKTWLDLMRLQQNDPANRAEWEGLLGRLEGDPASEHTAFLRWLRAHDLSEREVIAAALRNASTTKPGSGREIGNGLAILEPVHGVCDLLTMEGINPEFVRALNRQRAYIQEGNLVAASAAIFDTPGHYILPFGPATGTELQYGTSDGKEGLPRGYVTGPHRVADTRTGCEDAIAPENQKTTGAVNGKAPANVGVVAFHWSGHYPVDIRFAIPNGYSRDGAQPGEVKQIDFRPADPGPKDVWFNLNETPNGDDSCWRTMDYTDDLSHMTIVMHAGATTDVYPGIGQLVVRSNSNVLKQSAVLAYLTKLDDKKTKLDDLKWAPTCQLQQGKIQAEGDALAGPYTVTFVTYYYDKNYAVREKFSYKNIVVQAGKETLVTFP